MVCQTIVYDDILMKSKISDPSTTGTICFVKSKIFVRGYQKLMQQQTTSFHNAEPVISASVFYAYFMLIPDSGFYLVNELIPSKRCHFYCADHCKLHFLM